MSTTDRALAKSTWAKMAADSWSEAFMLTDPGGGVYEEPLLRGGMDGEAGAGAARDLPSDSMCLGVGKSARDCLSTFPKNFWLEKRRRMEADYIRVHVVVSERH